jgi:type I restriction enzyme, S subunit
MSDASGRQLPKGWELRPLSEIAEINPALDRLILDDELPVTFVPMRAVEVDGGGLLRPEIRKYGEVRKGYTPFLSGDVITAKITPCMENGKTTVVPVVPGDVCFGSTEFHVLRPLPGIHPNWIAQFLLRHDVRRSAQRQMSGAVGQMRVPASFLESAKIPVPPSAEQFRIAEALDEILPELDHAVVALKRVRDRLKIYRTSVLKAAGEGTLTIEWRATNPNSESSTALLNRILAERRRLWEEDQLTKFAASGREPPRNWTMKYKEPVGPDPAYPALLPSGWCWATVDQVASVIQYGSSSKTNADSNGIPVLRMGNLRSDGRLTLDDLKYLPNEHYEFPGLILRAGDLLFNRTNSAELVGKTAVYTDAPPTASFASYLIRVRLIAGTLPSIVAYALNSLRGRAWIKAVANQTVGQANVNGSKLAAFTFPLPPVGEQAAIVDAVADQFSIIDHLEADLETRLRTAQALRESILRHAFTGQLVQQDPNDEPAFDLLRRIARDREARNNGAEHHRTRSTPKRARTRRRI